MSSRVGKEYDLLKEDVDENLVVKYMEIPKFVKTSQTSLSKPTDEKETFKRT